MQVEVIRWLDTGMALAEGWKKAGFYASQANLTRMEVVTVGLLVYEDDDVVVVANSYDREHDAYVNAQVVAKVAIISRATPLLHEDVTLLTGLRTVEQAA